MNTKLLATDVQEYLSTMQTASAAALALKKSPFEGISSKEIAQQVDGRQRAAKKIPAWTAVQGMYYPEKLNMEQCSSAETGQFKASLLHPGTRLIDLTGGFGVDSYYFARQGAHVTHCEINPSLSAIVQHNFKQLGLTQVTCVAGDGINYLKNLHDTSVIIYIDPSRRVAQQKVFRLADCEPNVVALQALFFEKATCVITKLAPLLDISLALQQLEQVKDVYIISVDNDCKELLFVQDKQYTGETKLHAIRLTGGKEQRFTCSIAEEQQAEAAYAAPEMYLYDPDVAITKAGAFKSVGATFGLSKLHQHTHLYTSSHYVADFPGRCFRIQHVYPVSKLKKNAVLPKANIVAKNFPMRVEDIRKKFKIADGGSDFLYFCTLQSGEHVAIHGVRFSA
ncbi:class I SAM-dependent methyltransferase [Sphingobacterium paludis]|uniref:RNA cap guanine-N2 methyltransferase n=1 Tax=Sphingobacterium paludis TaxID=1476465 RepID=A0A4R7D8Y2_9SPHI|nr:class I SAM-dependent methyltransferase [Sphingobacterium paludis]TDS17743.1 RNA cap guanine-N2 methyltransferase [Sphingobacterium paludis]